MPTVSIDQWLGKNVCVPEELYALSAATPLHASAGSTTSFRGIFVDTPSEGEVFEVWDVIHSTRVDAARMAGFRQLQSEQKIVEIGAITIAAAVLEERSGVRLGNVQKIGTYNDYTLVDRNARSAGVIEFKGVTSRYTSEVASRARGQVRKSKAVPKRIGVVAFGGPELRLEVVR